MRHVQRRGLAAQPKAKALGPAFSVAIAFADSAAKNRRSVDYALLEDDDDIIVRFSFCCIPVRIRKTYQLITPVNGQRVEDGCCG
jgi:hypothetical protein